MTDRLEATMKAFLSTLFLSLFLSNSVQAVQLPGDARQGQALHAKHCVACHDSGVYTRSNRRVQNVEGLTRQVNTCVKQIGLPFDRTQVDHVVNHLNASYYRFK